MPVASATAEMPFSVLRRLKTYVRSNMKNDRLSFLGLMHILTEILKWTCTKQWRCSYLQRHEGQILDNLKKFLSIEVIKIVLDSMLYETLEWPQIAPFCISSKQIPDSLTFSRIMACIILSLSDVPDLADKINCLVTQFVWCPLPLDGLSTCLFCLRVNPLLMISEGIGFSSCKSIKQLFLKLFLAIRDEKIFNLRNT